MSGVLKDSELAKEVKKLPEWELVEGALERQFEFEDFNEAMEFVNLVAEVADEADHHPDIDIRWNKVRLALVTHSAGGITEADIEMAQRIDRLE